MGQAVRRIEEESSEGVVQDFAIVTDVSERTVVYERGARRVTAVLAAGCLVAPEVGDRVLVAEGRGEAFVLAVLKRAHPEQPLHVRLDGDLEFDVAGRLRIAAREGVDLATEKVMRLASSAFKLRASDGEATIERFTFHGVEAALNTQVGRVVATRLDSFIDRLALHVKRSYRTVEEMEQVRAERLDYRTKEEMSFRAKRALVDAADLVRVTGAQIHMG